MKVVEFNTIGKFYINIEGVQFDAPSVLGRQLSSLLAFFVFHRTRIVSKDMLIEAFWRDSENPASAIKYAVFRLRNELSKIIEYDWIVTSKMGYMLNPSLEINVDLEQFEEEYHRIIQQKDMQSLIKLELVNSQYLVEFDDEWIITVREYFDEICNKMVMKLCEAEIAKEEPNFEAIIFVTKRALDKDPYSETIILYYCRSLIEKREYNKAITFFDKMSRKFNDELGIPLGDNIKKLFLGDQDAATKSVRIEELPKEFEEDLVATGPLYCTQMIFKKLYHVYVRKARRDHNKYHIVMFEITNVKVKQNQYDEVLETIILETVRKTDIYTKFSINNYGILVEIKADDDIFVIIDRIQKKFYNKIPSKNARLHYFENSLMKVDNVNILPTTGSEGE